MLTAIFCTYLRYDLVKNAVRSLLDSEGFDPSKCRVLVVDNTPADKRSKVDLPKLVDLIACDQPGLSNARNAGISASNTEVVAFIDDDALVLDGWLPATLDAFAKTPEMMICGGKTVPLYEADSMPPWWSDSLASHLSCIDWGDRLRRLKPGEWVVGANIAYRTELFRVHGLFNPALGRQGNLGLLSNEETAIATAVGRDATYYNPEMIVQHIIPPERMSQDWFRKRTAWQAISDALSGEGHIKPDYAWKLLSNYMLHVPAAYRSTRGLYYPTDNPKAFTEQLKAIYSHGVLFCNGFPEVKSEHR